MEARTLPSNPAEDGLKWAAIAAALAVILMGILLLLFRARKEPLAHDRKFLVDTT